MDYSRAESDSELYDQCPSSEDGVMMSPEPSGLGSAATIWLARIGSHLRTDNVCQSGDMYLGEGNP